MISKNRGVALITVLLILALITPIVTHVALKQRVSVNRTATLDQSSKSIMLALDIETWARTVLLKDLKISQHDSLDEAWAQGLPSTFSDSAKIAGQVSDLQNRFNLNTFANEDHELFKVRWLRLLAGLNIESEAAQQITQAIEDWVDVDSDIRFPGGAEDVDYMSLQSPYRAANQMMADSSELRLIRGVTAEIWEKVKPFVSTLPESTGEANKINVNTAPIKVLTAIFPEEASAMLAEHVDNRVLFPLTTLEEFKTLYESKVGSELSAEVESFLGVKTNYFLLNINVILADQDINMHSILKREDENSVKVVGRYF